MPYNLVNTLLDKFFDPVVRSPEVARELVKFEVDQEVQARVSELAHKTNEGTISNEEREEYRAFIEANDFIGVLQLKARHFLQRTDKLD